MAAVCNSSLITSLCLRTLYSAIDYVPQVPGRNKVGLNNFLGETNNRSYVRIFLEHYRQDAVGAAYDFKIEVIVCNGFALLDARGVSLFFGSGESGVGVLYQ